MSRHTTPTTPHNTLSLTLPDAARSARKYWAEHHLLTDLDADALDRQIDRLTVSAQGLSLATVSDALAHGPQLLSHVTEIENLTRFATRDHTEDAHRLRNTLGAVLAGAAQSAGERPEPLLGALPGLARRSGDKDRRLHGDETLLLRHRAVHGSLLGGRHHLAACQYALTEAGSWTSETTRVRPRDVVGGRRPTEIHLPGVRKFAGQRTVRLPDWARPVLARGLDAHLARSVEGATEWPFAYSGFYPAGSPAARSAVSSGLARAMQYAGLPSGSRPQPLGIVRWRVATTLRTQGVRAAAAVLGRPESPFAAYTFTGTEAPAPDYAEPQTYLGL